MPATTKAQFRFMATVAHGGIKKKGLPPAKAEEYIKKVDYTDLPRKVFARKASV